MSREPVPPVEGLERGNLGHPHGGCGGLPGPEAGKPDPSHEEGKHALRVLLLRLEEARDAGQTPLVIFDLDSTLIRTSRRNVGIFQAFVEEEQPGRLELRPVLEQVRARGVGWSLVEEVEALGVGDQVLLDALQGYWRKGFFSSRFLYLDEPYPGAVAYVRACHQRGACVVYLTGRDRPGMGKATEESLLRQGFPLGERAVLSAKPGPQASDLGFKREALPGLCQQGPVLGAFENEPAHVNLFRQELPQAAVFLLDTMHSRGAPALLPGIYRVKDFTW